MNKKIIPILFIALAVASLSLAESTGSSSKPANVPSVTLEQLQAQLSATQAELQKAVARMVELEQRVRSELEATRAGRQQAVEPLERRVAALEQSNAKLKEELRSNREYRLVPLERE